MTCLPPEPGKPSVVFVLILSVPDYLTYSKMVLDQKSDQEL